MKPKIKGLIVVKAGLGYVKGVKGKPTIWYGWSHRAYYGFKIGSKVSKGDVLAGRYKVGFVAKTDAQAAEMARQFSDAVS